MIFALRIKDDWANYAINPSTMLNILVTPLASRLTYRRLRKWTRRWLTHSIAHQLAALQEAGKLLPASSQTEWHDQTQVLQKVLQWLRKSKHRTSHS